MNRIEQLQPQFQTSLKGSFREIESSSWSKSVEVNVVFGLNESGLPSRFLAGFLPPFSTIEALQDQKNVEAEMRIFIPLHLASHCNSIPLSKGETIIQQGVFIIQKFQEIFHPKVSWFLDIDEQLTQQAIDLLIHLSDAITTDTDRTFQQEWKKIHTAAEHHGSGITAKIYAPHHVFGWHDCWNPELFFQPDPKHIVMNCLSRSEEKFQIVRKKTKQIIAQELPDLIVHGDHLDLITTRCPGPHYIRSRTANGIEPSFNDLLLTGFTQVRNELEGLSRENPKILTALKDLDAVDRHISRKREINSGLPNMDEFIQEMNHAIKIQ